MMMNNQITGSKVALSVSREDTRPDLNPELQSRVV